MKVDSIHDRSVLARNWNKWVQYRRKDPARRSTELGYKDARDFGYLGEELGAGRIMCGTENKSCCSVKYLRRSPISNHSDTLSTQRRVNPTRWVKHSTFEIWYPWDVRKFGDFKYSNGWNQDMRGRRSLYIGFYILGCNLVNMLLGIPVSGDDHAIEHNVRIKRVFFA